MKPRRQAPSLARRPVARPDPGASPRRDAGRPALLLRYLGGLAALLATLAGPQALRAEGPPDPAKSRAAVEALADGRDAGLESAPLTRDDAGRALRVLADRHAAAIRKDRAAEVEARRIELGGREMPFFYRVHGAKPEGGRSLYLSLHGGGGAPARVNDQQYENQKGLYRPAEGVYLAPRAPSNTWDLWHQGHVDAFLERLIEDMVVFEGVDPDRVYLMGYSAGGDGVYQLAPRMADRLAAAAMMAGHPNESRPLGLRNIGFALHVGAEDAAYDRNRVAREYGEALDTLRGADPEGYPHLVEIHAGRGHWMNREDASALPWMARFRRDPAPKKVVWFQDDATRDRSYWLAVEPGRARPGTLAVVAVAGQEVRIEQADGLDRLTIRLDDRLLDLDRPVRVLARGRTIFEGPAPRTIATLRRTLDQSGDPGLAFVAEIPVTLPPAATDAR